VARSEALVASGTNLLQQALALGLRGYSEALVGHRSEAKDLVGAGIQMLRDLGNLVHYATGQAMVLGEAIRICGDVDEAYRLQVEGTESLQRMGETGYLSTAAGYCAHTAAMLGREEDAERYIDLSRRSAAADDFSSQ